MLVESGTDVNKKIGDGSDNTPLKLAIWAGSKEIVQYLLQHGAKG